MGALLPELQTERLTVRLARPGMQAAMARFLAENYPGHLDKWSPPAAPAFFTESFWRERLAIAVEEFQAGRAARFVLQLRETGRGRETPAELSFPIVGTCNYTNIVRGPFQACHLGYSIDQRYEGRGLMREALGAALGFIFDAYRLHRVMASYRPDNARSGRLLENLGFEREGLAKAYLKIDGQWADHVLTSLVNPKD